MKKLLLALPLVLFGTIFGSTISKTKTNLNNSSNQALHGKFKLEMYGSFSFYKWKFSLPEEACKILLDKKVFLRLKIQQ